MLIIDETVLNTANGAGEGANVAQAEVYNEMVVSDEEPAEEAGNTAAATEDIPQLKRGVFGCGNGADVECNHGGVTTFSDYFFDDPTYKIDFEESLDEVTDRAGEGTFDAILQEYSRDDERYLQLGHDLLRPGGKLYVIVRNKNYGGDWLYHYAVKGENVFGTGNLEFTKGLDNIKQVGGDFGVANYGDMFEYLLTFTKPG